VVSHSRMDIVVANGPRVVAAAAGAGCPVVFHLHSRLETGYARVITRASLRYSHGRAICASKFVAGPLGRPATIIYNGVRDLGYEPKVQGNGCIRVGIIGRLAPEKGHMDFIAAAHALIAAGSKARFTIHGTAMFSRPAYEEQLRAMAGPSVEFHGWTDNVAGVLHELDILAVPSRAVEASPRVVLEALSAGTPVVAYPSGGIPELIEDGVSGVLTQRSDYASLAESVQELLGDRSKMASLSRNGRQEWEARFRVERFQRDVCDLLESSVEKAGQP
ncbi:MAG: glycosyltransferase family 4 protein, partial [Acidobacteriota bacterium]|nr:glycosyltransferase family 4 protein [Acidobacteriota bacterium]